MKKTILVSLLTTFATFAQAPVIEWQQNFGGSDYEWTVDMKPTPDGGYILAATTRSSDIDIESNHGDTDYWVVKTNASGTIEWQTTYGGSSSEFADDILVVSDGYIVVGITRSNDGDVSGLHGTNGDCWIVKINNTGIIQWKKTLGGFGNEHGKSIISSTDGGFIVAAQSSHTSGDVANNHEMSSDIWILKFNSAGTLEWQKNFGGSGGESPSQIIPTNDSGYLIVGSTDSNDGDVVGYHPNSQFPTLDSWIVKIDASGTLQWQKTLGGSGFESAHSAKQLQNGGYFIAGSATSLDGDVAENNGGSDVWLVWLDANGNLLSQKNYGGLESDICLDIAEMPDNGYVLACRTFSSDGDVVGSNGSFDAWILRTNEDGELLWQSPFGGSQCDAAYRILHTADDGFLVTGVSHSSDGDVLANNGEDDIWMFKLFPEQLSVNQFQKIDIKVYPNPARNFIQIQLPENEALQKLCISDVSGKIILKSEFANNNINVESFASGIYFLQVESSENKFQTKFIKQ